ncbi:MULTISPECIES: maleylpyruvate isomerase family mycothiol-dependent enzyme [Tsukamurella]|uniref:Maleylpyruvate isomerase family mycothiol-dependent enzyme n=2 Tax=Tsukamurella TaxID=2060 RepID=A0A5C5S2P7_9ACTN|nr:MULTISPECIES: maleylpyruvate isomerase family mycothiol-dependent enzyme [Tsukamurella]NMD56795.1 maleylpyruvate isomerase family mycothiol-dependent enzyme [Tsukamurella columbiensis]TWS29706.1 maleylpyruvate isomerase family mycothiol-dependent enzyme [Tsukamurella conjunctivitidis]
MSDGVVFRDLPRDEQLTLCRRGTAHFARHLGTLSDAQLGEPCDLDGWTRRHLLAHVAYNAAALCRLMDWAITGTENPMYASPAARAAEIDKGATLPPSALRNLFDHTVARLDEKWRNASPSAWSARVRSAQGRDIAAAETIWMRAREVWVHAVDLGTGARFGDAPPEVLDGLLSDVVTRWRSTGEGSVLELRAAGRAPIAIDDAMPPAARTPVAGDLAAVTRWAAGRGAVGLSDGPSDPPPHWL